MSLTVLLEVIVFKKSNWENNKIIIFYFFLLLVFTLSNVRLTHPATFNANARGSDASRGRQTMEQNTRQELKGATPLICGQQNIKAISRDNTDKGHSPRIFLKFLNPPAIEPAKRYSTNHTIATD